MKLLEAKHNRRVLTRIRISTNGNPMQKHYVDGLCVMRTKFAKLFAEKCMEESEVFAAHFQFGKAYQLSRFANEIFLGAKEATLSPYCLTKGIVRFVKENREEFMGFTVTHGINDFNFDEWLKERKKAAEKYWEDGKNQE